ncbi:TonB-dependent siderophore receptor [Methylomonas fluvii]|uniref:TonB-dependent receptor n=1 Tax=Methylomonas fluvii TaxID=1854564 RepID=A0ABR9DE29_9GAMM|nr:TonB-dependent receptor [Methylomonas fluvii]MBD9360563.1 TonB-dependent receptor [Methylomonas fluvii]
MSSTLRTSNPGLAPSRLHLAMLGILLASALTVSAPVHAENGNDHASVKRSYHIAGGSLSQALRQFATVFGLLFVAEASLTEGKTSVGLEGEYSVEEGFRKLLAGSGLTHTIASDKTVTLKIAQPQPQSGTTAMPAVTVIGQAVYDSTDPYNPDYSLPNATTGTKTDTPIMETPFSVQVVSKQVMEDVQAIRPGEALNYVSGIYQGSANSGDWLDWTKRRGFDPFPTGDYRDGGAFPLASAWGGRDLANIEQVEVLKGPASLLYGQATPGGVVNYVTKKPLAAPYYSLQQQFGSYDYYRTTLDATGPITQDKTLLYRFNLAYKDANSFRDTVSSDRIFIAPTVSWIISPRTRMNFELEYDHGHMVFDRGVPAIGSRPADVPRSRFFGEADPQSEFERILVDMNWSHAFNDNWTLSHRFTAVYNGLDQVASFPSLNADNVRLNRSFELAKVDPGDDASYFNTVNLTGHFDTWGLQHTLLLGGDYFRQSTKSVITPFSSPINIFNPIYLGSEGVSNLAAGSTSFTTTTERDWFGLYMQDQIKLPYHLHLMGGLRYDSSEQVGTDSRSLTPNVSPQQDKVTPRGGLVWQPIPELSLYGSYSENFTGINGTGLGGVLLAPETAQQWEFGLKTELFDKRFLATLAWFDLTKQNARVADPRDTRFSAAIGEANVTGLEMDLKGEILPGWNMIGSYAYTPDAVTTIGRATEVDKRFPGVPRHGGSLFTTYELQSGIMQGLKFGGGVIVRSSQRTESTNNDVVLPGYATVNLLTSYSWKVGASKLTTQLNVNNLLGKEYYPASAFSRNSIEMGAPRTFMGSVRIEY